MAALRERHKGNEWAWFEEVPDGTGAQSRRRADGLAMNLWPSRGLELHGFEVKVDRTDWKNEATNPEKAEALARFCDRWWLVVDDLKIIEGIDVPLVWGILVVTDGKIRTHREASKLEAIPVTRSFVASILRRASDAIEDGLKGMVRHDDVEAEVTRRVALSEERIRRDADPKGWERMYKDLREWADKIHAATGIRPGSDYRLPTLRKLMDLLANVDPSEVLKRQADMLSGMAKSTRDAAALISKNPATFNAATRHAHNSTSESTTDLALDAETIHVEGTNG